ncbi:MAG: Gfo/Idh/MocA family oxidoreductase [Planctomycetes bacterium]|nr:Gfo/Idh/MocA family oxidoreductase [Planctomycetota bacterium]
MSTRLSRRRFLKRAAFAASALSFPAIWPRNVLGANGKLNIAGIGVGDKGESDIGLCAGENVVALCDVDDQMAARSFAKFPQAKRYKDYRKMLEEEKSIDAVTVSTPDHVHAPASIMAMRLGKHVHCQKPLTHSVSEARLMAETAREKKVATQMGNQGFASPRTRRLVELIRAGALGKVKEIHVWTDRPIWPQGIGRPAGAPECPKHLDWDLWIGPAPVRPYHPAYAPFKWRGFWDFGTGALGDIGCHSINLPFFALELGAPSTIEAQSSPFNQETFPEWEIITYQIPAKGDRPPVTLIWYDGGKLPPLELMKVPSYPKNGAILAGDKDTMGVFGEGGARFLSGAKLEDFTSVPETLPRAARAGEDADLAHRREWIEAAKGGPKAFSNFEHAGPLTELVLLGNIALRTGKKIEWDPKAFKITNVPEANPYLNCEHRKGWEI